MDYNSAEVFLTITKEGSFRKAAARLGYTQAGISYIVHSLEEELGLNLFIRDRSGVRLSPEGEALLPHIKQLSIDHYLLQETVNELRELEQGMLRVQIFDSISIHWIPGILQQFKRDYPGITVELITEEDSLKAEEMVMTREVDCGFLPSEIHLELDAFPLNEESLLAVVAPDHELASAKSFPVSQMGAYPYINLTYSHNIGINAIFEKFHVTPDIAYNLDNDSAAMAMVSKGLGYTIFPELFLKNAPYALCGLEFDIPQKRTVSIATRSMQTASGACIKFIEYTRRWVEANA